MPKTILSDDEVSQIIHSDEKPVVLADRYGVTASHIYRIKTGRRRKKRSAWDRFTRNILREKPGGCWLWQASCYTNGRGMFYFNDHNTQAHRAAWEMVHGPIPDGQCICHRCDNIKCVNPDHLFMGTTQNNVEDKVKKNRQARGCDLPHTKLSDSDVREIRSLSLPGQEIADKYGITRNYVYQIRNNTRRLENAQNA